MGNFVVNVAVAYQIGAARDDYSILSAMDIGQDELFAAFGQRINDLILDHREHLEAKRKTRCVELNLDPRWLEATSRAAGPKRRWVDGTPEYAFYICGLRKLFPDALFIHIFRDGRAVVRSMLNFHRIAGTTLVPNEEEAYKYWLRTVRACIKAEQAYGPSVVHRVRYTDLVDNPELTMRSLLEFLDEPLSAKCLEPLLERINSSNVPPHFTSDDPATDPAIVEEARQLSAEMENAAQPSERIPAVAGELEAKFGERVKCVATVETTHQKEQSRLQSAIAELQRQLDDLSNRLAQANDQISQMSRLPGDKNVSVAGLKIMVFSYSSGLWVLT